MKFSDLFSSLSAFIYLFTGIVPGLFTSITIIVGIIVIVVSFFSTFWSNLLLSLPIIILIYQCIIVYLINHNTKINKIPELSEEANKLFRKYFYQFTHPFASKDFRSSCIMIILFGFLVSIVNSIRCRENYITFGIILLFVMSGIANCLSPQPRNEKERKIYDEVWNYIFRKR